MKRKILISIIGILVMITLSSYAIEGQTINEITYEETVETIINPDRGFYYPMTIKCKPIGMKKQSSIYRAESLVHLRIGLKEFSARGNLDKDYDINQEVIDVLNSYMEEIRKAGGTSIIRFAYDDFIGTPNLEPDIEQIEKHIDQLKPFFYKNADVITSVESGLLGSYGEQHSSKIVTNENLKRVVDALLESVPKTRTISVRKPSTYCYIAGVNLDEIDKNITTKENPYYRVGIFNDGYLGSSTDLGTYKNRKKEINWLYNQATHSVFGGEAVKVDNIQDKDENGNLYNSPEHIEQEMFITHTTYLNEFWNDKLVQNWKNTLYKGSDILYTGKTVFQYIDNHLGYRMVLRKSQIPNQIEKQTKQSIKFTIENVGAGNVVNSKDMYIILYKDNIEYSRLINKDITNLLSKQKETINVDIDIPENFLSGNYEVYLKIVNKGENVEANKRCIQFANKDVWNNKISANKLGTVEVIDKKVPDENKNETNTNVQNNVNSDGINSNNTQISPNNVSNKTENKNTGITSAPETGNRKRERIFQFVYICLLINTIILVICIYKKRKYSHKI